MRSNPERMRNNADRSGPRVSLRSAPCRERSAFNAGSIAVKIAEICSQNVQTIAADAPLAEAARRMQQQHVGALVVVDESAAPMRPKGIVTDRDIVCGQLAKRADLHCLIVSDVMNREPATLPGEAGIGEAIETLRAWGVRRAPVVNEGGELIGIVTIDDLLPALAAKLGALAALVGTQARREPKP